VITVIACAVFAVVAIAGLPTMIGRFVERLLRRPR